MCVLRDNKRKITLLSLFTKPIIKCSRVIFLSPRALFYDAFCFTYEVNKHKLLGIIHVISLHSNAYNCHLTLGRCLGVEFLFLFIPVYLVRSYPKHCKV